MEVEEDRQRKYPYMGDSDVVRPFGLLLTRKRVRSIRFRSLERARNPCQNTVVVPNAHTSRRTRSVSQNEGFPQRPMPYSRLNEASSELIKVNTSTKAKNKLDYHATLPPQDRTSAADAARWRAESLRPSHHACKLRLHAASLSVWVESKGTLDNVTRAPEYVCLDSGRYTIQSK